MWPPDDTHRHCLSALAVICYRFVQLLTAQPRADRWGISPAFASPVGVMLWLSHPLLPLPPCRATGEEVSGHLALPLHLDKTATVQLVSIADKHVVKVCGHLTADTDIDKVSDILSKQNTSITVAEWLILYKVKPNGSFYLFQSRQQKSFFQTIRE